MPTEYIIGTSSVSRIKIPSDKRGVSGQHLKITIQDDGSWVAEDLQSTNGTFIRDENGNFNRIYKKNILESDVIRLGKGGANSFIFMAKRVEDPTASYQYEFKHLKSTLKKYKEQEAKKESRIALNGWISKSAGLAVVLLCTLLTELNIHDVNPNLRYGLIAMAPLLVGLIFQGDAKALRTLRNRRQKIMLCPSCGKLISEFDIEEGQCSRCKAK